MHYSSMGKAEDALHYYGMAVDIYVIWLIFIRMLFPLVQDVVPLLIHGEKKSEKEKRYIINKDNKEMFMSQARKPFITTLLIL